MEISADAVDEVRKQLRGSFHELVSDARDEYERMADIQDIDRRLAATIEKVVLRDFNPAPPALRATIHVRDIVFREYLYQFVEYYPSGGGQHRRFSQRYGIIGRTWRSGRSHGTGNAFGTEASTQSLIEEWGMTREETHGVLNSRPSCLSILLKFEGEDVGILYVDSTERDAFKDTPNAQVYAESLEAEQQVLELAAAVSRAMAPLRVGGPNLDFREAGK
jgi:hypothetical protein